MPRKTATERFWSKVDKTGGLNACWLWKGGKMPKGYGRFWDGEKDTLAHRFAYELVHGALGKLYCLHSCDTPACVNERHLFAGTHDDNMADMATKKRSGRYSKPERSARGERHGRAALTDRQAALILGLKGCAPQTHVARLFGISQAHVSAIQLKLARRI